MGMKEQVYHFEKKPKSFKNTWNKKKYHQIFLIACFFCFVLGILVANRINPRIFHGFPSWNLYFSETFYQVELFYYISMKRIPIIIVLFMMLLFTNWGKIVGRLFLLWQGFSAGFLMATSVIVYGIKGILLIVVSAVPHYLVYIPLYITYLCIADFLGEDSKNSVRKMIGIFSICFLLFCIYMLGIFLESYINPYILKNILDIFK